LEIGVFAAPHPIERLAGAKRAAKAGAKPQKPDITIDADLLEPKRGRGKKSEVKA